MDICNHKQLLSKMSMLLTFENRSHDRCAYLLLKSDEYPLIEVETTVSYGRDLNNHHDKIEKAKIVLGEKYLAAFGVSLICVGRDVF